MLTIDASRDITVIQEETWSMLHDEQQTVTAKSVSMAHSISRAAARDVLNRVVLSQDNQKEFVVHYFDRSSSSSSSSSKVSRIALKEKLCKGGEEIDSSVKGGLYSLSLTLGPVKNKNSHSRAGQLRAATLADRVAARVFLASDTFCAVQCAAIRPYSENGTRTVPERFDTALARAKQFEILASANGGDLKDASKATAVVKAPKAKLKATTAASFFDTSAKKRTSKEKERLPASRQATGEKQIEKPIFNKSDEKKKKKRKVVFESDDEEGEAEFTYVNQKENKHANTGNADDFVGDVDEDEEDMREEALRRARKEAEASALADEKRAKRSRAAAEKRSKRKVLEQSHVVEESTTKSGAMDNFVAKTERNVEVNSEVPVKENGKKRRRKLVEKTSMDSKGYIHTEMVYEWEDILTDDEENTKPIELKSKIEKSASKVIEPTKRKTTKVGKGLKQTGLMGFFSKKK